MPASGSVLFVDLTARASRTEPVDLTGAFGLGGKTLGIRLLERYLDPAVDPLSPANVVVLTTSLLAGYSMSGSNRFGAFSKSPLTGIWLESYCGGTFAGTFVGTGWDALVITGAADSPVQLHVDAEGAHLSPADDLWGKDTLAVEEELLSRLDKRSAVLSIGVAGEKLVKVASVMHDQSHTLGRCGLGAVFGSKNLKALTVTSHGLPRREASEAFVQMRREVAELAAKSPIGAASRTFGTPAVTALTNRWGAFPTDFFTKGTAPHAGTLEAESWAEWATREHLPCPPCPLRCRKRLTLTEGPEAGRVIHGPEYETIYAFGGSCSVQHPRDVAELNEHCNRLGLDTISTGNLVASAIKARELGLVGAPPAAGAARAPAAGDAPAADAAPAATDAPAAGDVEAITALLGAIARRSTSLGDLLARGMDEALAGLGMPEWSITTKGLDPAGYEPRGMKSMAFSYAVGVRGADHLRATFYKAEFAGMLEGLDDDAWVQTYIDFEDRMLLLDSLTMCRFYRDLLTWELIPIAVAELHGAPVTKEQLERLSTETITRIRRFNLRCGATPADDTVAERFFRESTDRAPALDRAELERRVRIYWAKRGWGAEGLPQG
jgi:aldehyde:ferredoxin oxidoreductase